VNEFKDYNIHKIIPILGISKSKSGPTGFSKAIDLACKKQDINKPFTPFAILEDDCKKFREFPNELKIPDDADMLYIGNSIVGWDCSKNKHCYKIYAENINEEYIKIFNMLSSHGIIICSLTGLISMQKCMTEAYFKNKPWDTFLANIQPHINTYALKKPLVYQYKELNGYELQTKIDFNDLSKCPLKNKHKNLIYSKLPNNQLNKTDVSIITNY
jgi:hypothetical protein